MPGARSRFKLASPSQPSASDEATLLDGYLQRKLEEDIARIFDESLYSDLEVVCGKLKVLTHSCILKTRTKEFYNKLNTILHLNIDRNTFDEIYSFISDAYIECNIKHQENEIITYLDENLNQQTHLVNDNRFKDEDNIEAEVYLTPRCSSPYAEKVLQKSVSSSPSTEINKEYYALVPIENTILDKELKEQDVLSSAFKSIIKSQTNLSKICKRNIPTSLSLVSSHTSILNKHSKSRDEVVFYSEHNYNFDDNKKGKKWNEFNENINTICSPDSLVTDEPSSSSDYLSTAYTCSPELGSSGLIAPSNVDKNTKMENAFTSSDSGVDNIGGFESFTAHVDATQTDTPLSGSMFHDLTIDESHQTLDSVTNSIVSSQSLSLNNLGAESADIVVNGSSSNQTNKGKKTCEEEILIAESSSLSSETGSWESVFPPKFAVKDCCENFLRHERQYADVNVRHSKKIGKHSDESAVNLVQKSPFKSTSCFIDAASLADEEDHTNILHVQVNNTSEGSNVALVSTVSGPSRPVPCSTAKQDISPNDDSEGNENDDSLEQNDRYLDPMQRDISPTIFEMTLIPEDFSNSKTLVETKHLNPQICVDVYTATPNNSIMSFKDSAKFHESEDCDAESMGLNTERHKLLTSKKFNEYSPILSGGASIEDHLSKPRSHASSPLCKKKVDNIPIVSGTYGIKNKDTIRNEDLSSKSTNVTSSWVVDMSSPRSTLEKCSNADIKIPPFKICDSVKKTLQFSSSSECSKSRSSVDSDGSEKSSQKFYIDLASLSDTSVAKQDEAQSLSEKKNIFSMYIDIGAKSKLKEMPPRLSSSLKNRSVSSEKNSSKSVKVKTKPFVSQSEASVLNNTDCLNNVQNTPCTFELYETLCNDPTKTIGEIISLRKNNEVSVQEPNDVLEKKSNEQITANDHAMIIERADQKEPVSDLFVKLSDLDKPLQKSDITDIKSTDSSIDVRMTRSIPERNWSNQTLPLNSRSVEIMSSFHSENTLSLNRLFPHLKHEFSKSMPGSLSSRTKLPLRLGPEDDILDKSLSSMTDVSSIHNSVCRRLFESNTSDDSSQSHSRVVTGNYLSRLGKDLLRMFLEEIAPDVVVQVSGRRIKAHKCILSSRCQYFAGILSGGWVESAGNVILLSPFSYNVVHFALCHIYSGMSVIPDSIDIVQLATLADMLCLEGLKEAIMFTLKAKYCHHFHKPCTVCTAGVLECFPVSSAYGLDDLYRKCLIWITKYFTKVWPTKAFATLPKELLDKCYQQHIVNLTTDNLVETVYGCGITVASLHNSRWAETVVRMCQRLVNAAAHFAAPRLVTVLKAVSDIPPVAPSPALQALNDCITVSIEWAPPDETCRAYAFLSLLVDEIRSKPDLISNGTDNNNLLYAHANSWRLQCESALVRAAPREAFKELPPDLRKRLRALGCIMYGSQSSVSHPTQEQRKIRSAYQPRPKPQPQSVTARSFDLDHVRATLVSYAPKLSTKASSSATIDNKSNNDLRKAKLKTPAVRTTKAQEERAKYNLTKNLPQERPSSKAPTRIYNLESTKPRYLDPRPPRKKDKQPAKKLMDVVSSNELSRNSSPVAARRVRDTHDASRLRTADPSTDSLSDSLNSNRYATYTKAKHGKGSVESIKSSKCQPVTQSPHVTAKNPNKMKTKIPIVVNRRTKPLNIENHVSTDHPNSTLNNQSNNMYKNRKAGERKLPGSLMNATQSSSAKVVTKATKDPSAQKLTKLASVKDSNICKEPDQLPEIPIMDRSGTFLKDEPTFGDKSLLDIDK